MFCLMGVSFMGNRRAKHLDEMVKEKSSSDL
jgi:hypothetical protein